MGSGQQTCQQNNPQQTISAGVYWTAVGEFSLASCHLRKQSIAQPVIMMQQFDSNHKLHSYNNNQKKKIYFVLWSFPLGFQTAARKQTQASFPPGKSWFLRLSFSHLVLCSAPKNNTLENNYDAQTYRWGGFVLFNITKKTWSTKRHFLQVSWYFEPTTCCNCMCNCVT